VWRKTLKREIGPHGAVVGHGLNGCRVGGENDDVLGEVAVEVVLGEADRSVSNAVAVMPRFRVVWAILVPWRKATAA
jgi:hypothetical protein